MLTKEELLRDLDRWFRESGDMRFVYLIVGLQTNRLTVDEAEDKRHEIHYPEMHK